MEKGNHDHPVVVTDVQLEAWHRDGFLILEDFADRATLAALRGAYDDILSGKVLAPGDRQLGAKTRQVMRPSEVHPAFAQSPVLAAALDMSRHLLSTELVARAFDMLIYKPPEHPHETPWHQDAAYDAQPAAAPGTAMRLDSVQFWIPLDDVDLETGCMQFVPGRHAEPLLEHRVASGAPDDEGRLLALVDPAEQLDLDQAVSAEIPAGAATVHSYGTPHYTGPNRSSTRQRRSYIINVAVRRH